MPPNKPRFPKTPSCDKCWNLRGAAHQPTHQARVLRPSHRPCREASGGAASRFWKELEDEWLSSETREHYARCGPGPSTHETARVHVAAWRRSGLPVTARAQQAAARRIGCLWQLPPTTQKRKQSSPDSAKVLQDSDGSRSGPPEPRRHPSRVRVRSVVAEAVRDGKRGRYTVIALSVPPVSTIT